MQTRTIFQITITLLFTFFSIFCHAKDGVSELIGKDVIMPECYIDKTNYTLVHIIRDQECTKCSVSSLYQWNDVIAMIGRENISYFFIIEARPEDTPNTIKEALLRRPFSQAMFVDYSQSFLEKNQWLKKKRYRKINDFILDRSRKIVKIGNPLDDFHFMIQMKNM